MTQVTEEMVQQFADELRKWWRFDDGQQHRHSWHDREDFIEKALPAALSAALGREDAPIQETATSGGGFLFNVDASKVAGDVRRAAALGGEGWRDIASAPKDKGVLIYMPDAADEMRIEIAHTASDDPDGNWYLHTVDGPAIDVEPTHWRPLPASPSSRG